MRNLAVKAPLAILAALPISCARRSSTISPTTPSKHRRSLGVQCDFQLLTAGIEVALPERPNNINDVQQANAKSSQLDAGSGCRRTDRSLPHFDHTIALHLEKCIAKPGWRRFLSFSANVRNDGDHDIDLGDVTDPSNPWVQANVLGYSGCHHHYHFSHYGNFQYGGLPGNQKAFYLEDTDRTHNDEKTSLTPNHQSCEFQGITAGWGDEYQVGLPCQGVDITDADTESTNPADTTLSFLANPDQFICEGFPALDSSGNLIFDLTDFISDNGLPVSRERCNFTSGWDANNLGSTQVAAKSGTSFVSQGCRNGEIGPLRDCGFSTQPIQMPGCIAGQTIHLSCKSNHSPQVIRVCEKSEALGGVDCAYRDSLANGTVNPGGTTLSFACPAVRDGSVAGTGGYSVYRAPLLPSSPSEPVSCTNF